MRACALDGIVHIRCPAITERVDVSVASLPPDRSNVVSDGAFGTSTHRIDDHSEFQPAEITGWEVDENPLIALA